MAKLPPKACPRYSEDTLDILRQIHELWERLFNLNRKERRSLEAALERVHGHTVVDDEFQPPLDDEICWTLSETDICDALRRLVSDEAAGDAELSEKFSGIEPLKY